MKTLAIIPARGGSKRIPRKNIKYFLGKPIIAYPIEVALESKLFNEVMVSTDDEEIASIAIQYGANVPFMRTKETANDFATTMDVLTEVTSEYKNKFNAEFDYICCIYATAPLIRPEHLREGYELMINKNFSSVYPIVSFGYPIWRGLRMVENQKIKMIWPKNINARSQDLETVYHDAGQWYWYKKTKIKNSLFTDNSAAIILDEINVQDIDSITDWQLAELKYELRLQNTK